MSKRLLRALLGVLAFGPAAFAVTFTGNVPTDFSGTNVVVVPDPLGDVSVPQLNAPPGTIPGWDVAGAHFDLNRNTGTLAVGLDFFVVAGDADGDGIDGFTTPWLAGNGGADYADLANSESICIAFDFDQNGSYELIAGDSFFGTAATIGVYNFAYMPFGLATCFGAPAPAFDGGYFYTPALASPDFELNLANLAAYENLADPTVCFNFQVFAGANWDDGIGEDFMQATVCFTDDGQVEAHPLPVSPDLVRAYPNPFNPTTTLAVELAETGDVNLSVYNLNGQLVRTLVDGQLSAGSHQVAFNAAGLPSGLYLARLSTVSGEQVSRLVLTK